MLRASGGELAVRVAVLVRCLLRIAICRFIQASSGRVLVGFRCPPCPKEACLAKIKGCPLPTHLQSLSSRVRSRLQLSSTRAWAASSDRSADFVPASEMRPWPTGSTMEDVVPVSWMNGTALGPVACAMSWLEMVDARHGYAGTP